MTRSSKRAASAAPPPERLLFPGEIEINELAAQLRRTRKTILRWVAEGRLPRPCRRIYDLIFFNLAEIARLGERQPDRRRRRKA
jgi:predicted DNA-binding transcriptional regulator AlpA